MASSEPSIAEPGPAGLDGVLTYDMLGVRVHGLTTHRLYNVITDAIERDTRCIVGNHNLHSVYLAQRDPKMQEFYRRAQWVFIDGMALVMIGRVLGFPLRRENRMTSIDWLRPFLPTAVTRGWRIMLLGSRPGVAERAAAILRGEFPGLEIAAQDGYFDASPGCAEAERVLERITGFRPHLLCVGMGMPRQEHWIVDHADRLTANVVLNLGGFMDLLVGDLPLPPRWLASWGFEWVFRLASHPQRVWRRYLVEPWFLLPAFARDLRARHERVGE